MEKLENLKQVREEKELTQVELAKKVGVSIATYLNWERGVGKPNDENMEKLIEVLEDGEN